MAFYEWKIILSGSIQNIYDILTGKDSKSQRIRSSNPFVGILSEKERQKINQKYLFHLWDGAILSCMNQDLQKRSNEVILGLAGLKAKAYAFILVFNLEKS